MHIIENNIIRIGVVNKGAELQSIYHKQNDLEYMWDREPSFWSKSSPVLFPIVGALKKNTFYFQENVYKLFRHGFAREMEFKLSQRTDNTLHFILSSNNETLKHYPFHFEFYITYTIRENELSVNYNVVNIDKQKIYFSLGGHPAFKLPLVHNTKYSDYFLSFNKKENAPRWLVTAEGLIEKSTEPLLSNSNILPLSKDLFYKDAIVLKNLQSNSVNLISDKTNHGLSFDFTGFPFLGIWAARDADFICIEPWCGIADSENTDQQLINKEGINFLSPNENFTVTWKVKLF